MMRKSLKLRLFGLVGIFFATLKAPIEEIGTMSLNSFCDDYIVNIAFSPDSNHVAITTKKQEIFVFSTERELPATQRCLAEEAVQTARLGLRRSFPRMNQNPFTWKTEFSRFPLVAAQKFGLYAPLPDWLKWSPDGQHLAVAGQYGELDIYRFNPNVGLGLERLVERSRFNFLVHEDRYRNREYLRAFAWRSENTLIGVSSDSDRPTTMTIRSLNIENGEGTSVDLEVGENRFCCFPEINIATNRVAIGFEGGLVKVFDLTTGQQITEFNFGITFFIKYLKWIANSLIVAKSESRYGNGILLIVDPEGAIRDLPWNVYPIIFTSPDFNQLIIQAREGQVVMTSLENPAEQAPIEGLPNPGINHDSGSSNIFASQNGRLFCLRSHEEGKSITFFTKID